MLISNFARGVTLAALLVPCIGFAQSATTSLPSTPASRQRRHRRRLRKRQHPHPRRAFFSYADNYLIDLKAAIVVDVRTGFRGGAIRKLGSTPCTTTDPGSGGALSREPKTIDLSAKH
jgi:hypothetical protein